MDKEIADQLEIAPRTVENHVRALPKKAGVESKTKFAAMFQQSSASS